MDALIIVVIACGVIAWFLPLDYKWIALIGGAINVYFNLGLVQAITNPPWWATLPIIGWFYTAPSYIPLIMCFVYGALAGAIMSFAVRLLFKRGSKK
jgi:hypothetical protein